MRRIVPLTLLVASAAAALAGLADARPAACRAGVRAFDGSTQARTFCGPAKATVEVGGATVSFSGGSCETGAQYVTINIGTVVLGQTTKKKPEYFGLTVGKVPVVGGTPAPKDGTYGAQAVAWVHAGKGGSALQSKVTLTGGRKKGTFTGTLLGSRAKVTGSFSC